MADKPGTSVFVDAARVLLLEGRADHRITDREGRTALQASSRAAGRSKSSALLTVRLH